MDAAVAESASLEAKDVAVAQGNFDGVVEGRAAVESGDSEEVVEGERLLGSAESIAVLEGDCVADDGSDNLRNGQGLIADCVVKKCVGNVGAISVPGEETAEAFWLSDVLLGLVPVELVGGGLPENSTGVALTLFDADDVPRLERFVDGLTDGAVADVGSLGEVGVGEPDLGLLGGAVGVGPTEDSPEHVADQAHCTSGGSSQDYVEELVWDVGGVGGGSRVPRKQHSTPLPRLGRSRVLRFWFATAHLGLI